MSEAAARFVRDGYTICSMLVIHNSILPGVRRRPCEAAHRKNQRGVFDNCASGEYKKNIPAL